MNFRTVLPGIPVSSNRGALGWCTVSLIKLNDKKILIDTGSYGDRKNLIENLANMNLRTTDIDIVLLTHLHYDHCLNSDLFTNAKFYVSKREIEYVINEEYITCRDPYAPQIFIEAFQEKFGLKTVEPGDKIEEIEVVDLAGHTPGSVGFLYKGEDFSVIFAGDAVKCAWDLANNIPPPCFFDYTTAKRNYELIRNLANIIVPGHDKPFVVQEKKIKYIVSNISHIEIKVSSNDYEEPRLLII